MPVNAKVLQSINIFQHLDADTVEKLANIAKLKYYNRGDVILAAGQDDKKTAFLVYGKINVRAADGRIHSIRHDQQTARTALCNVKPRRHTITAEYYDTCIVWFNDRILDVICTDRLSPGIELEIVPDRRAKQRTENPQPVDIKQHDRPESVVTFNDAVAHNLMPVN